MNWAFLYNLHVNFWRDLWSVHDQLKAEENQARSLRKEDWEEGLI